MKTHTELLIQHLRTLAPCAAATPKELAREGFSPEDITIAVHEKAIRPVRRARLDGAGGWQDAAYALADDDAKVRHDATLARHDGFIAEYKLRIAYERGQAGRPLNATINC